ncbi:MAG: TadE family protein [Actinobacteria bacterium]|nr:TadE family protein [Actinomycetota bacterium]
MTPPTDNTANDKPRARWTRLRDRRPRGDAGLAVLELVIATTVLISVLLLVVGFGRYSEAQQLAEQAAGAAARAASLDSTPAQATRDAQQTAADSVASAGQSCTDLQVSVDTSAFHPGGQVSVTVSCTADLSQLTLAGFGPNETVRSTQTAPLENYRDLGERAAMIASPSPSRTTGVPA